MLYYFINRKNDRERKRETDPDYNQLEQIYKMKLLLLIYLNN